MAKPTDDLAHNLRWWEERAALHADTPMYRPWLASVREGTSALRPLETQLAGDVTGLDVLHLPCHIGHDTVSWALLGARSITGVDFSPTALKEAKALANELHLDATWVHADGCDLPGSLDATADLVVSTYGAYGWMYDLKAYVAGVARALRPGGRFLLVDGHPVGLGLSAAAAADGRIEIVDALMGSGRVQDERPGTYADADAKTTHNIEVGWCHGIGDLFEAVHAAGLTVRHYAEHDHCVWQPVPNMVPHPEGWALPEPWGGKVPLMFSLVAEKAPSPPSAN